MMTKSFSNTNPLLEFDIYRDEDELCMFISFLRMAARIVLYTYKTEEKVKDSGSLRQWEEELCPYDFPTKEEKENAKMTKDQYDASVVEEEEKKEPHSYEGIYLSKNTGRLFELLQTGEDEFTLTYCDDGQPFLYNPISGWVFRMHLDVMEYYEPVFSYLEVERGMV